MYASEIYQPEPIELGAICPAWNLVHLLHLNSYHLDTLCVFDLTFFDIFSHLGVDGYLLIVTHS